MKKVLIIFILSLLTINSGNVILSQGDHDKIEQLFHNKSLRNFENDINPTRTQINDFEVQELIDKEYQDFHWSIKKRLLNKEEISQIVFDKLYQAKITATRALTKGITPKKQNPTISRKSVDSPCDNMDFEQGNVNGWSLTRGDVDGSAPYSFIGEYPVSAGSYHQFFGNGTDRVTGIPTNNPLNGNYSVMLGNGTGVGAKAARMSQTFLVDSNNYLYTYSYAVIFESPDEHTLNELPYFTVRVFDEDGNNVPCGEYSVIADADNAPGYSKTTWYRTTVLYQDWQNVFTNLKDYIGQNVTIEFTSGDCSLTGHFGYTYLDASCDNGNLTASKNLICEGDSSILSAPDGAANYLWSNGDKTSSTTVYDGGTYTCSITPFQGGGCSVTMDISIAKKPKPIANFTATSFEICSNDLINLTDQSSIDTDGTIANYKWDFGDGIITPASNGVISGVPQTSGNYQNPSHQYTTPSNVDIQLIVESTDGCFDTHVVSLIVNETPIIEAGPDQEVCENTSVILNASGASMYQWDHGVTNNVSFVPAVGTTKYHVTGTNQNGCNAEDSVTIVVNPNPIVEAGNDQYICEGNNVTLTASGADSYVWNNGVQNGIPFSQAIGNITYSVQGSTNEGCVDENQVVVTVFEQSSIDAGNNQIVCKGEVINLSANTSNGINLIWSGGSGTFNPTNQSNTQYTQNQNEFNSGEVTLFVTAQNPNGCPEAIDSIQITITQFSDVISALVTDISCAGMADGEVTVDILNPANGPFSYSLDNGPGTNNNHFTNLLSGNHQIRITNSLGCDTTFNRTIVEPQPLLINLGPIQNIKCHGSSDGSITVVSEGGVSPYQFSWNNAPQFNTNSRNNLAAGNYSIETQDANGCTENLLVTLSQPDPLIKTFDYNPILCADDITTISVQVTGGMTPYQYIWGHTTGDRIISVGSGTYDLEVIDSHGCVLNDQIIIESLIPVTVSVKDEFVACNGDNVSIQAIAQGGSGNYTYNWSNNPSNHYDIENLTITGYQSIEVEAIDENSCSSKSQFKVDEYHINPNEFSLIAPRDYLCYGDSLLLDYIYTGNTPIQSVEWTDCINCPFPRLVSPTESTEYSAILISSCGDTLLKSILIEVSEFNFIEIPLKDTIICPNETVDFYLFTNKKSEGWPYEWDLGNGTTSSLPSPSTTYNQEGIYYVNVTLTNDQGCKYKNDASSTVTVSPKALANFESSKTVLTTLDASIELTNLSQNAVNFFWDFGDGNSSTNFEENYTYSFAGNYIISLIADNEFGCSDTATLEVNLDDDDELYIPNAFTPNGDKSNNIFYVQGHDISENGFLLQIYNRLGELIHSSNDINQGWDGREETSGKNCPDGTYIWIVYYHSMDTQQRKKVGHVNLMK